MHEWALAEAVISTALEVKKKEKLKQITEINIKIGELQQIEEEIFNFALKELMKNYSLFKKTKLNINKIKCTFQCRVCGYRWNFNKEKLSEEEAESIHFIPEVAMVHLRCPKCKSPDFEIVEGRGVWIDSIKGAR